MITTYNRGHLLEQCLWTLFELGGIMPDEVVICDDRSTDNTFGLCYRLAAHYPVKAIRRDGKPGWQNPAIPRNVAIRHTRSDANYILLLEPEMLVPEKTLEKMLLHFKSKENLFVNVATQGFAHRVLTESEWKNPTKTFRELDDKRYNQVAARCTLIPREAMFKIRGYDEGMVLWGHDDTSAVTRLQMAGYEMIQESGLFVVHQNHEAPPASADTANINLARMQSQVEKGIYAPNDGDWGEFSS